MSVSYRDAQVLARTWTVPLWAGTGRPIGVAARRLGESRERRGRR